MKISDHYSSSYLKTEDFDKKGKEFTMLSVQMEEVGGEEKPVLYFDGIEEGFPLNKTNAEDITDMYGDDTEDWDGKLIVIYRDKTMYNGKRTDCLRVKAPREASTGKGSGSGSRKPAQQSA